MTKTYRVKTAQLKKVVEVLERKYLRIPKVLSSSCSLVSLDLDAFQLFALWSEGINPMEY